MKSPEENLARAAELQREAEQGALDFVKVELATALTFARIAKEAGGNTDKRRRNQANARKAYDTLLDWRARFHQSETMREGLKDLEPEFQQLKSALEEVGEVL